MATLATAVFVDGKWYAAGEEAPEGVSNPAATDMDAWTADSLDPYAVAAPEIVEEADEAEDEEPEPADVDAAPVAPPKAGPGSSADAWKAHAAALGVDVPEDAGRDEVIAAVEAAQS